MPPNNYRRRRGRPGPSKNELRAQRNEKAKTDQERAGTLAQRYPRLRAARLDLRMESATGNPLGQVSQAIALQETSPLQFPCPSSCDGQFNLTDAFDRALAVSNTSEEGLAICEADSYMDPRAICGTKIHYRFTLEYNA